MVAESCVIVKRMEMLVDEIVARGRIHIIVTHRLLATSKKRVLFILNLCSSLSNERRIFRRVEFLAAQSDEMYCVEELRDLD